MYKIELTSKQKDFVFNANSFINVAEGACRSGKSVSVNMRFLRFLTHDMPKHGVSLFGGYSNGTVRRNIVQPLQELIGPDLKYYHSPFPHCKIWGREILCVGFGDISSVAKIQGCELNGALLDELTRFNIDGFKMLQSRFSIEGAKQFASLNPDSPFHWVKEDVIDNEEISLFKRHYTLDDNPHLPEEYVHNLKCSYKGVYYDRYICGIWCLAEGVIYDFFTDEYPHVITDEQTPQADYYSIGVDYGIKNPNVFLLIGHRRCNPGELKSWVHRELYWDGRKEEKTKTDSMYRRDLKEFIKPVNKHIDGIYIDPSAASLISEFQKDYSLPPVMEVDNSVLDGIRTVSEMLDNGLLAINEKCVNLRKEIQSYMWDEKAQKRGEDKPMKEQDHGNDALRYNIHTKYGGYQIDYEAFTKW